MTTKVQTHPLISIRSDASVQEAARLMADCSIGALGVLGSNKEFVGIITERDLSWFVAQAKDAVGTTVAGIVIRTQLLTGVPAILEASRNASTRERTDAEIRAVLQELLDREVNRSIAAHGGRISIVDVVDTTDHASGNTPFYLPTG